MVLFIVKWYRLRLNQRDLDRTIVEHDNGFNMVNTRLFEPGKEPYVLPSQCEQVFYSKVPGKACSENFSSLQEQEWLPCAYRAQG